MCEWLECVNRVKIETLFTGQEKRNDVATQVFLGVARYTAQQAHPQPVSTEHRTTHTQHTTCCHSTKLT